MKLQILKYAVVPSVEVQTVRMPMSGRVLHVGEQNGGVRLWVECAVGDTELVPRKFLVLGTGWEFDYKGFMFYRGTAQVGSFVWHVYEEVEPLLPKEAER